MSEGGKVPWTLPGGFILKLDGQRYILLGMPSGHCMQLVSFLDFAILTMSSSALGAPCIGKETGLSIGPLDRASTEIGVNGFFWWFVHGFLAGIVCIHTVPFVVRFWRRERFLACRGMSTSQTRRVSCRTTRNGIYAPTALRTLLLNSCASVSSGRTLLVAPWM